MRGPRCRGQTSRRVFQRKRLETSSGAGLPGSDPGSTSRSWTRWTRPKHLYMQVERREFVRDCRNLNHKQLANLCLMPFAWKHESSNCFKFLFDFEDIEHFLLQHFMETHLFKERFAEPFATLHFRFDVQGNGLSVGCLNEFRGFLSAESGNFGSPETGCFSNKWCTCIVHGQTYVPLIVSVRAIFMACTYTVCVYCTRTNMFFCSKHSVSRVVPTRSSAPFQPRKWKKRIDAILLRSRIRISCSATQFTFRCSEAGNAGFCCQ